MFKSLHEVKQVVEANGGVITVEMRELRDAFGAAKLGVHILSGIASGLTEMGLRTMPTALPNSQNELVRVFEIDGPIDELWSAIIFPGKENDELLRQAISTTLYVKSVNSSEAKALRQIRNIIDWHFATEKDEEVDLNA